MSACSKYTCGTRRQKGDVVPYHNFPSETGDRRDKWILFCDQPARVLTYLPRDSQEVSWTPATSSRLCGRHFTANNYIDHGKLRPNTVPTIEGDILRESWRHSGVCIAFARTRSKLEKETEEEWRRSVTAKRPPESVTSGLSRPSISTTTTIDDTEPRTEHPRPSTSKEVLLPESPTVTEMDVDMPPVQESVDVPPEWSPRWISPKPGDRSPGYRCTVIGCSSSQKDLDLRCTQTCALHNVTFKNCPCHPPYQFHCYPTDATTRTHWVKLINRAGRDAVSGRILQGPGEESRVCSKHFVEGKPSFFYPSPVLDLGYGDGQGSDSVFDQSIMIPTVEVRQRRTGSESGRTTGAQLPGRADISVKEEAVSMDQSEAVNMDQSEASDVTGTVKIENVWSFVVKEEVDEEDVKIESAMSNLDSGDDKIVLDGTGERHSDSTRTTSETNADKGASSDGAGVTRLKSFDREQRHALSSYVELLKEHALTREFSCLGCGRKFKLYDEFSRHCLTDHCNLELRCPICFISFPDVTVLDAHTVVHQFREKDCLTCGKSFTTSWAKTEHIAQVHGGNECCKFCFKQFEQGHNLRDHILCLHSTDAPQLCHLCGMEYKFKRDPMSIVQYFHTAKKIQKCEYCDNPLTNRVAHVKHECIRVGENPHIGENPYICEFCGRGFRTSSNLKAHVTVHKGEKLHACDICGKTSSQRGNMRAHRELHSGSTRSGEVHVNLYVTSESRGCAQSNVNGRRSEVVR